MTNATMRRLGWRGLAAAVLATMVACGGGGEGEAGDEASAGPRYESPELGLALAAVPAGFEVEGFVDGALRLLHVSGAELSISTEQPVAGGVNLVEAIQLHKEEILGREAGDYKGQTELMSQFGSAYASRGRWTADGVEQEETAAFLVHPTGDRLLRAVYTYPAGEDSRSRLEDELFAVVVELEDLGTPAEPPADASEEAPE